MEARYRGMLRDKQRAHPYRWALKRGESFQAYARKAPNSFSSRGSIKEAPLYSQANKALILMDLKSFRISDLREYPQKSL
jgi:hypothetical protein